MPTIIKLLLNMEYRKSHLINKKGEQKIVETRNLEKELSKLNESSESEFTLDMNWYLNNGYSLVEDVFRSIEENGGFK